MLSQAPAIVISISDCQAVVTRYRPRPDGSITCESACNTAELEADAIAVITANRAPFTVGTHVPCPPELAARAVWPDTPAQN